MPTSPWPTLVQAPPPEDRRAWKRRATSFEAFYQYRDETNGEVLGSGQVVNISRGGLRILSGQAMAPGTAFRIGIADGKDGLFTLLAARVVYLAPAPANQWFIGCHFTPKLREEILAWMERISEKSEC